MSINDNTNQLEVTMKRPLCPILLIGFNPPEEGQRDLRRCNTECAMYDEDNKQCCIRTCAEQISMVSDQIDDLISISGAFIPFEEDENFEYDAIGQTH